MTSEGRPGPQRSELSLRVMSGIVMVAAAVLTLWWGGWPFALLWIVAGAVAAWEWSRITAPERQEHIHLALGGGVAFAGVLVAAGHPYPALGWTILLIAVTAATRSHYRLEQVIGVLYASAIAIAPIVIRAEPGIGIALIAWCFAVVWSTDIAAYFTGRRFGGPKLWPAVSPKKTWSGAIGGACAGVLAGVMIAFVARQFGAPWTYGMAATGFAALIASAAGQLGDLYESALKRRHGVKDSSHIIPGHGGVLDRLDAFVVVAALVAVSVTLLP